MFFTGAYDFSSLAYAALYCKGLEADKPLDGFKANVL